MLLLLSCYTQYFYLSDMKNVIPYIVAILFVAFAAVQINDPDPWLWVTIYMVVAVLAALVSGNIISPMVYLICSVVVLLYFISYIPDLISWARSGFPSITDEMKAEEQHIELVRESLGLLISAVAIFYLYRLRSNSKGRKIAN